jgi:hypothetical protein
MHRAGLPAALCFTGLLIAQQPASGPKSTRDGSAGLAASAADAKSDVILRAMRDELLRSRTLKLTGLDPPYFIEYSVDDTANFHASSSLGALIASRWTRARIPQVHIRVGSPEFDNTNSIFSNMPGGARFDSDQAPLDDNYEALRQLFWLATDRAYKGAVEAISRKRAVLRNLTQSEKIADFAEAKPVQLILNRGRIEVNEPEWAARTRSLSSIFRAYPSVLTSSVEFEAVQNTSYYINAEGSLFRIPDTLAILRARAMAQASDGMSVHDAVVLQAFSPDRLGSELDMRRAVEKLAADVSALVKAPRGERYSGPVLLEPQAAAQLFASVLARNLSIPRKPVSQPNYPLPFLQSELEGRIGSRILPEWMDVVDDPRQKEWRGHSLLGHYPVDLEAVPPEPLTLVEKGVLKNYLMTRQPVRGFSGSNGRARLPGGFGGRSASVGNMFVRASQTVAPAALRQNLMEIVQKRGLPYGIIIRKLDFPSSASTGELRRIATAAQSTGSNRPVSSPILVYRLYPDGREELIRGLRFRGLNVRAFRDIIAASDENFVFDYLENNALFSMMSAGGYVAPTSVIAPAVLFEDLELDPVEDELPRPPVVPPPVISQSR